MGKDQNKVFECLNCHKPINLNKNIGTANRNHCPFCLWSKHVDLIIPGDRKSDCLGLMKPVSLDFKKDGEIMLVHKCVKCNHISKNRIAGDDDPEEILKIESSKIVREALFGKMSTKGGWTFSPKKFKKIVENFTCQNCGDHIIGTGFTDHCPSCLWSKHVDISPGDRLAKCDGMMESIASTKSKDKWRIFYRCQQCGYTHFNKISPDDDMNEVIKLSARPIPV